MRPRTVLSSPGAAWVAAALGAWLVAGACRTMRPAGTAAAPPPEVPSLSRLDGPIRVGILVGVERVSVGADSGVVVRGRGAGERAVRLRALPRATFRGTPEGRLRLLETGEELETATLAPASVSELLQADASRYRGLLEIRGAEPERITVVNSVPLEEYLRGVVPNELSPEAFPQIEALKAQAVAARTYALAHRGDYAARGFDVCATASCQVYRGANSEHPLSDRAVEETQGVVATWQGRPINAYYTSTCGGHTEDAAAIFGEGAPYLRGVPCLPERSARHLVRTTIVPPRDLPGGPRTDRDLALLVSLGVVAPPDGAPEWLSGIPGDDEIRGWTRALLSALHRPGCPSPVGGSLARRASLGVHLVSSVCWTERAERLLGPEDAEYLLQAPDSGGLDAQEREAMALLVPENLLSPHPDGTLRPDGAVSRAETLSLLAGIVEKAGAPALQGGEVGDVADGQLSVRSEDSVETRPLADDVRLFRDLEGVHAGARELSLSTGDRVGYVVRDGRVVFLEAEESRRGAAADRTSRYYQWEVRLTPAQVGRAVARYGSVGAVRDVVPRRLGVSGRVVELAVRGTDGELLLKGLRVRWGLGLRENLFVIDRERDAEGAVERFVFTGKGWGHGVGLCQVGAFGMARSGSTYDSILKHYYTGIDLLPVSAIAAR